jgi:hypothetical protein
MIKIDHNVETNEITEIELSAKEIAELKENAEAISKKLSIINEELAAKAAEKAALLAKLGITEDEARLLLG